MERKRIIELEKVCKTYYAGSTPVEALTDVDLQVEQGEFLAIVGKSGSGKSTLMNIIGCLDLPTSGIYRLEGEDVAGFSQSRLSRLRGREIGFVFQGFHLIPTLTAQENVELPLLYRGYREKARQEMARKALDRVGLAGRRDHRPQELSGGQQQRVAIARALAAEPKVLLADEPTGNLDQRTGEGILEMLRELHTMGKTVLMITHDPSVARAAQRQVSIADGRLYQ